MADGFIVQVTEGRGGVCTEEVGFDPMKTRKVFWSLFVFLFCVFVSEASGAASPAESKVSSSVVQVRPTAADPPEISSDSRGIFDRYFEGCSKKLWRGIMNTTFGGLEIWVQMGRAHEPYYVASTARSSLPEYIKGFPVGLWRATYRTLNGVLDSSTFFIPTKPTINPEYVLEDHPLDTRPHVRALAKERNFQIEDVEKGPVYR